MPHFIAKASRALFHPPQYFSKKGDIRIMRVCLIIIIICLSNLTINAQPKRTPLYGSWYSFEDFRTSIQITADSISSLKYQTSFWSSLAIDDPVGCDFKGNRLFYQSFQGLMRDDGTQLKDTLGNKHELLKVSANWSNILPVPNNSDKYFCFTVDTSGIYETLVSGKFGKEPIVISVNRKIVATPKISELRLYSAGAIRHGNGRDWWLVWASSQKGGYWGTSLITEYGGDTAVISQFSQTDYVNEGLYQSYGPGTFPSPKGDLVVASWPCSTYVARFDRCSGVLDTAWWVKGLKSIYCAAFSPCGKYLYATLKPYFSPSEVGSCLIDSSTLIRVHVSTLMDSVPQIDTLLRVGTYFVGTPGYKGGSFLSSLSTALDGRIWGCWQGVGFNERMPGDTMDGEFASYLWCINDPDSVNATVNLRAFRPPDALGGYALSSHTAMRPQPNFLLGPDPRCALPPEPTELEPPLSGWPVEDPFIKPPTPPIPPPPAFVCPTLRYAMPTGELWLEGDFAGNASLALTDALGRTVTTQTLIQGERLTLTSLNQLSSGFYHVTITIPNCNFRQKLVVVQ